MKFSAALSLFCLGLTQTSAVSTTEWTAEMFNGTEATENCGSLYVSVYVTQPPDFPPGTLVSANTLFAPYSYSLSATELVSLNSNENICNVSTLSTSDYRNLVLLLEIDETECTAQTQVYNAEMVGVSAVLFYNNKDSTQVYSLEGDSQYGGTMDTTIPSRMVSQNDGVNLKLKIEENGKPAIELNCENGDYSQTICVYDSSDGSHWELDGDYEAQDTSRLGHPIWLKEGYESVYESYYIYLDVSDSQEINGSWQWVLANGTNDTTENIVIHGYCEINYDNETIDPSTCPEWYVINYDDNGDMTGVNGDDLVVDGSVCEISDNYFCMDTEQRNLDEYAGTYHQVHDSISIWIRELDDSSATSIDIYYAYIIIDEYTFCNRIGTGPGSEIVCSNRTGFLLYDETNEILLSCNINDTELVTEPIDCETWYSRREQCDSMGPGGMSSDCTIFYNELTSFDIDDGWCTGYLNIPNTTIDLSSYPDSICLNDDRNDTQFSYFNYQYLYGTFSKMEDVSIGNAPVYYSERLDGSTYEMYIYLDDVDDIWVLDDSISSGSTTGPQTNEFGQCPTENAIDPTQCSDCWKIDNIQSCKWWSVTEGACNGFDNTEDPDNVDNYSDNICVTFSDGQIFNADGNGLYDRSEDLINGRYYYSFTNSNITFYIYYFSLLRYWVFSEGLINTTTFNFQRDIELFCMEYNNFDLVNCSWERQGRGNDYDWEIHSCVNDTYKPQYEYEPTRMPTPRPTRRPTDNPIGNTGTGTDTDTGDSDSGGDSGDTGSGGNGGNNNNSDSDTDDQDNLSADNGVIIGLSVTFGIIFLILGVILVVWWSKKKKGQAGFGQGFAEQVDDGNVGNVPMSSFHDHDAATAPVGGGGETNNSGIVRDDDLSRDDGDGDDDGVLPTR